MEQIEMAPEARPQGEVGASARWPVSVAGGVAVITLALCLLGYGYALAIESRFGIAQAHVPASPLDYLSLAGHVIAQLLLHALKNLGSPRTWWVVYASAWPWVLATLVAIWAFVAVVRWPKLRPLRRRTAIGAGRFTKHIRARWRTSRLTWAGVVLSLLVSVAPFVATAMLWFVLATGLSAMAMLPLLGLHLGRDALQRWVVEPARCAPQVTREQRLQPEHRRLGQEPVALCVAVRGLPGGVIKGRLVAATAHVAVLFDPSSGTVWRVPVSGATLEPVASLD
jgi:hypothetical protein